MSTRNPFAKDLPETAQGLREGATSETGALAGTESHPCNSYARSDPARLNTYLDAISKVGRDVGPRGHWVKFSTRRVIAEAVMTIADAEHAALTAAKDDAMLTAMRNLVANDAALKQAATDIAERDATIERLWAQLNEATNVPDHNDPEFGFDKTAALSDPGEDAPSPIGGLETSSGWSGPIYWTDDHDGNTTRCPGCYRATHQGTCR